MDTMFAYSEFEVPYIIGIAIAIFNAFEHK